MELETLEYRQRIRLRKEYTHELNREISALCGWYVLNKEEKICLGGKDVLYVSGYSVVESSCCGGGGCRYALVPGSIIEWRRRRNKKGMEISVVEPIRDGALRGEIQRLIERREGVRQIEFW